MTWYTKVMWTEGMFLQPQHFQQQDRYFSRHVDARLGSTVAYPFGFVSLQVDEPALMQGKIAVVSAMGVMRDGEPFSIPAHDAAPAAIEIPADVRNEIVVLAQSMARPGVAESDIEDTAASTPPRYRALQVDVADSQAQSVRQAPIHVGQPNLRLILARDAHEGYSALGVVRVIERRADGRLVLDRNYIPPMLHAPNQPILDTYLREILGLLRQRGGSLAARLAQPGRAGVGEIADFLLLQTINRFEPLFAHAEQLAVLHPERLYSLCLALAGDLATFREARRPPVYAAYAHDDLATCFKDVIADLRQSLSMVMEQTAIPIELQERKFGVRVAVIADVELQRHAKFVLAVNAQMPGEAVRGRFPAQVKIGPVDRIRDIVNLQLAGVPVKPMPVAPREIPYHAGFNYFELETQGNELWKQLENSGGFAMHIAGEFPGLEIEFWAIRT